MEPTGDGSSKQRKKDCEPLRIPVPSSRRRLCQDLSHLLLGGVLGGLAEQLQHRFEGDLAESW